jgi:hypothetical protein
MDTMFTAIGIARMFQIWDDTPTPTAAQLTALRHLQSDLSPLLAGLDVIPDQTDDPALVQAADRAHEALSALLAEMAVVIHRAKRRPRGEVTNTGLRTARTFDHVIDESSYLER